MKRTNGIYYDGTVDSNFVKRHRNEFNSNKSNLLVRNSLVLNGRELTATNADEAAKVDHIFSLSTKGHDTKAVDQGSSGRCWMYAGFNVIRHLVINALDIENFEFSATYLFFWDKMERANVFIYDVLDTLEETTHDKKAKRVFEKCMDDGGYYSHFTNLVRKYGLVPDSAMPETAHSSCSYEMNRVIKHRLRSFAADVRSNNYTKEEFNKHIDEVLGQVFNTLVKFLGMPPTTFDWSYRTTSHENRVVRNLTPVKFARMCMATEKVFDAVSLTNYPHLEINQKFIIENSTNMIDGNNEYFYNIRMSKLKRLCLKTILKKIPIWIAIDVESGYVVHKGALNTKIIDDESLFGQITRKMNKAERLEYYDSNACHAVCIVGVEVDESGNPLRWQIENSWGYYDPKEPGLDGYLCMDDSWFDEYVYEAAIPRFIVPSKVLERCDSVDPEIIDNEDLFFCQLK